MPNHDTGTELSFNHSESPSAALAPALERGLTRAEVMRRLNDKLPTNDLGLPIYIYRTDLIPPSLFDYTTSIEDRTVLLETASVELDYFEGFPSQKDGLPFWNQLDFEPSSAYNAFIKYLGIGVINMDTATVRSPVRTFSAISQVTGLDPAALSELAHLYYWAARAKAHDMFMVASFHKQREQRALVVEDSQFRLSTTWLKKAQKRLEAIFEDEDELMDMKPKEVFDMMERLMKLQRISAGLPGNGPSTAENRDGPQNASMTVALRTIAQKAGEAASSVDETQDNTAQLMADPIAMGQLQELIIKTQAR